MSSAAGRNQIKNPGDGRKRGALLGMAVGDALGTTYEFEQLDQAAYPALASGPAMDVVGGGPFGLAAGQITDDTQMAVCLARSLTHATPIDRADLAARYVAWAQHAFDIGNQTRSAIRAMRDGADLASVGRTVWRESGRSAAGNGSLMRTTPIAVAFASASPELIVEEALVDSLLTHADPRCALACAAFDVAIARAINGGDADAMHAAAREALPLAAARLSEAWSDSDHDLLEIARAAALLRGDLEVALGPTPDVSSAELDLYRTAGFVRVAFRLAFWHLAHTPSWRAAVVDVASRGGDADTNTAIVGALLGARDGIDAIPAAWVDRVLGATQPGPTAWAEAHHPRHLLALL